MHKILRLGSIALLLIFQSCLVSNGPEQQFVEIGEAIPDAIIDLRYYSNENFVGDTIDAYQANKCLISKEAAEALIGAQEAFKSKGYGIKVFDAYRPQAAVDHFARWAKDIGDTTMKPQYYPEIDKSLLFEQGYIVAKSGHSRGSTIDLTLVYLDGEKSGQELDMGTPWDYFGPASGIANTDLRELQLKNRQLLQNVMMSNGFKPLEEEWWHFTLKNEPYPDTYFDFPIQ